MAGQDEFVDLARPAPLSHLICQWAMGVFGQWRSVPISGPQFVSGLWDNKDMRRNPSKFFPFEKPIYTDLVFYAFLFISIQGMKQSLNDFYNYGDPSRLIPLLIDFASSIFVAWVISMPLNWIRGLIMAKLNSRNQAKLIRSVGQSVNPDLRITKLDKPIDEMDPKERRIAAEKIAEVMMDQAKKYKKDL